MNGKGDKPRPVNKEAYGKNYDAIKWNKTKPASKKGKDRG